MAHGTTRIPRKEKGFDPHIRAVVAYLLQFSPGSTTITNAVRLGFTDAELAQLQLFLTDWEALMVLYGNKKVTRSTDVIEQMSQLIKSYIAYDNLQHLYKRVEISPHANNTDFVTFNITGGTPIAKTSDSRATDPGTDEEVIVVVKIGNLYHELLVTKAGTKGRGKGKGVKDIMVYKAVTLITEGAPAITLYQYVGDTNRGFITVTNDVSEIGKMAWYIARVKNTRGVIGVASKPVSAPVI